MSNGYAWKSLTAALLIAMCTAGPSFAATQHTQKKAAAKKAPPAPLPSGPTGPMQPMPLDSIAAVPPQVSYQNNQLTIVAPNSTLADILRAVRKQTGAEIEVPQAPERVVTHLGPGPARDVVAELLNGSRFNYVLLGSPDNQAALTRVVLVAKSGIQDITPANPANTEANRGVVQANGVMMNQPEPPDVNDQEPPVVEDNSANVQEEPTPEPPPPAEAEQQSADPNGIKTPQQMLQEMQQRQMQLQQQQNQNNGQAPVLGPSGMPPHPPREQ